MRHKMAVQQVDHLAHFLVVGLGARVEVDVLVHKLAQRVGGRQGVRTHGQQRRVGRRARAAGPPVIVDQVAHHGVNAQGVRVAQHRHRIGGQVARLQQPGAHGVVDVVVDVGDRVGDLDDLPFQRARHAPGRRHDITAGFGVQVDALAHRVGQVQARAIFFQHFDNAAALFVVAKRVPLRVRDCGLAGVAERRVPEVVPQADRFDQIFVQAQCARDGAGDLRHLQRVREPRAIVIAKRRDKDLRFMFQPAKRLGVQDAVAVALKAGAHWRLVFGPVAYGRVALGRQRRKPFVFVRFSALSDAGVCRA